MSKKSTKILVLVLVLAALLVAVIALANRNSKEAQPDPMEGTVLTQWESASGEALTVFIAHGRDVATVKRNERGDLMTAVSDQTPAVTTPLEDGGTGLSDFLTVHISNAQSEVLTIYRVHLKGEIHGDQAQITAAECSPWNANGWDATASWEGASATAALSNQTYGQLSVTFTLNADGTFSVFDKNI